MAVSASSPNVDNYAILKGVVKFWESSDSDYRHLGNCPEFELTPELETLEHRSSMAGVSAVDRKIVLRKALRVRIRMEELTPENLGIILMGDVTNSSPEYVIDIFTLSEVTGKLRFIGTNDIGAKIQMDFPSVSFVPSGSINMISEEWASMEITADVLVGSDGSFGQALWNITGEVTTITI